jgi:SAM-dependent methyltransferase
MERNELTNRDFWKNYWLHAKLEPVSARPFYEKWLHFFPKAPAKFIEIGGFPGNHAAYFKKYHRYEASLIDFLTVDTVVRKVEILNGLNVGDLRSIQGDVLKTPADQKYDVVFSAGFVEHFTDTEQIFQKHCEYLKEGGTLFISLPNFNGISGWVQKWFDPENYKAHSLESMNPQVFENLVQKYGLKPLFIGFEGTPHLWLDHPEKVFVGFRVLIRVVSSVLQRTRGWLIGRFFSPYLIVVARK